MSENLDQFFDSSQGHTVPATFKTSAGVTVRTVNVIFTGATGNVPSVDGVEFEALQPFFHCRTADLAGIDHTHKVVIAGVTYRITNDLHDGTGTSFVLLKK